MSPRVTSDLLLVGSIPAASTEEALRAGAANFAATGLVFALPDGETGPRSSWVGYEREHLVRPNPDIETIKETDSPTGRPRHMYETPVSAKFLPGFGVALYCGFRVQPGSTPEQAIREHRDVVTAVVLGVSRLHLDIRASCELSFPDRNAPPRIRPGQPADRPRAMTPVRRGDHGVAAGPGGRIGRGPQRHRDPLLDVWRRGPVAAQPGLHRHPVRELAARQASEQRRREQLEDHRGGQRVPGNPDGGNGLRRAG